MPIGNVHGDDSVHEMDETISDSDDSQCVPLSRDKVSRRRNFSENFLRLVRSKLNSLMPRRNDPAFSEFLSIHHSEILRLGMEVCLIPH